MKGKIAFVLGAGAGYVLGTRAGRARYEQIKRGAQAVWATSPVQSGVEVVKSAVDDRVEAAQRAAVRAGKNFFASMIHRADDVADRYAATPTPQPTPGSTPQPTRATPAPTPPAPAATASPTPVTATDEARSAKADATDS